MRRGLVLGSARELGTVGLVAGLCGAYAGVLVTASSLLSTMARDGGGLGLLLGVVATVFILIALYVAAVVIVNAVDTVVAGRLRQIALLRLLGARAATLRGSVMRGAGVVGAGGAVAGALVGVIATDVLREVLRHRGTIPDLHYPVTSAWVAAPVVTVALTALLAGWVGSRSVLRVSPAQALAGSEVSLTPPRRASVLRAVFACGLIGLGAVVWLLMLPNSAYLVTELNLSHRTREDPVPLWYDIVLVITLAMTGVMTMALNVFVAQLLYATTVHGDTSAALTRPDTLVVVVVVIVLVALGMYLGRYPRLNSWDVRSPVRIYRKVTTYLSGPGKVREMLGFTLVHSIFLGIMYLALVAPVVYGLGQLEQARR